MRARPEQVTAAAAGTALGLGVLGMAFERADSSVMSASPEELSAWAADHHRALTAQSTVYLVSTAPLLAFFAGLGFSLRPEAEAGRLARSAGVLAGGATWLGFQAAAQAEQLGLARQAVHGAPAQDVAERAGRMRELLGYGNAALTGSLTAAATADGALPRWLRGLSAVAALAHAAPVVAGRRGRAAAGGAVEVLPYPLFVAWLVGVGVVMGRRARAGG